MAPIALGTLAAIPGAAPAVADFVRGAVLFGAAVFFRAAAFVRGADFLRAAGAAFRVAFLRAGMAFLLERGTPDTRRGRTAPAASRFDHDAIVPGGARVRAGTQGSC